MKLASGHEVTQLEGEELAKQIKDFKGNKDGLVRLSPGRWLFPAQYTNFADNLYNFQFKPSDVVVMTYPKCGTNWVKEIIATMTNNPNLDPAIQPRSLVMDLDMLIPSAKSPFLGQFHQYCPGQNPAEGIILQLVASMPSPRTIAVHLPFTLLHPNLLDNTKVVYVARHPKDVLVSYHHHCRLLKFHDFVGSVEEFVDYFVKDDLIYGSYALHLKEAWERRTHKNLHIVFYEDLKADPQAEYTKLNTFIGSNLTQEQIQKVVNYTSFNAMKARAEAGRKDANDTPKHLNADVVQNDGGFFRKGEAGDGSKKLSQELNDKLDLWMKTNMDFGTDFKYSISK